MLAVGAVELLRGGRVRVQTAPDPCTGRTFVEMDRLDLVHALCQQIPDAGMHMVRYYGAYANCTRGRLVEARAALAAGEDLPPAPCPDADLLLPPDLSFEVTPAPAPPGSSEARRRQAWARMLREVFEVDPLLCPRCGVEMEIVKGSRGLPSSTRSGSAAANRVWSRPSRRVRRRRRGGARGAHPVRRHVAQGLAGRGRRPRWGNCVSIEHHALS